MKYTNPRKPLKPHHNFKRSSPLLVFVIIFLFYGCSLTDRITGTATGNISPEIIAQNRDGKELTLTELRGSYVLIEFWESGNSTARANHFEMQRLFQKFESSEFENGRGFCIYSISLDTDKNKWMSAISQDKINWPCQVLDTRSWNADAAITYNVGFLPKYFLIDGNGVIVKKNILIHELEGILKENLEGRTSS